MAEVSIGKDFSGQTVVRADNFILTGAAAERYKKATAEQRQAVSDYVNLLGVDKGVGSQFEEGVISVLDCYADENQKSLIGNTYIVGGNITQYGPSDSTSAQQQLSRANQQLTQQTTTTSISPVAEVSSKAKAILQSTKGYTQAPETYFINGKAVDPYKDLWKDSKFNNGMYREVIGGSDLVCFYLAEVPRLQDIIDRVPVEAQQKELVMTQMDSVMSLSYSTIRERFPVRVIGQSNPIKFTQGPRSIAGHIAFTVFAEDVLVRLRTRLQDEVNKITSNMSSYSPRSSLMASGYVGRLEQKIQEEEAARATDLMKARNDFGVIQSLDSLAPFHILVMGVNERGVSSRFLLKDVQIVDENQYQGTAMPNITNKVSYVARDLIPMTSGKYQRFTTITSLDSITEGFANGQFTATPKYNTELTGTQLLSDSMQDLNKEK